MDVSIVVPCYNEREAIRGLQDGLFPVARTLAETGTVEIVLVDDGSSDGTAEALRATFAPLVSPSLQVHLVQHPENRGLGAALRTGFATATGEVVVTTDCDGTYRFAEIPALLACLTPGTDIVVASPYHPQGGVMGVSGYRLVLSKGSSNLYRLLVSPAVHTYTSLFRAYRRAVVRQVGFVGDGFLGGTELLVRAMLSGYRVAEYPTVLHVRGCGRSKAKIARTTLAHLRFMGRLALHRLHMQRLEIMRPTGERP